MKTLKKLILIQTVFSIVWNGNSMTTASESEQANLHHNYLITQSAGYLGFIAAGVGREYQSHRISALIGYVPEDIGGIEIWQLSVKYEWHPFSNIEIGNQTHKLKLDPFYIGMSLIYGEHKDLFVDNSQQYPDGYYPPTAIRSTLNIGTSLLYQNKYSLYLEYAALDTGLVAYVRHTEFFIDNYDYFGLEGIGSLAIGITIRFD